MNRKNILRTRFAKHFRAYDQMAQVQDRICGRVMDMLPEHDVIKGLEIGAGTGFLTKRLVEKYPRASWVLNDLVPQAEEFLRQYAPSDSQFYFDDAETLDFPSGMDIVTTASTIQWFDNMPTFFSKINKILNENGIFAFSTFGPDNFNEITSLTGQGLTYFSLEQLGDMLSNSGFEVLGQVQYDEKLWFNSGLEVLQHIKMIGVNGTSSHRWNRKSMEEFNRQYFKNFNSDGKVSLTYQPQIIITKKIIR